MGGKCQDRGPFGKSTTYGSGCLGEATLARVSSDPVGAIGRLADGPLRPNRCHLECEGTSQVHREQVRVTRMG